LLLSGVFTQAVTFVAVIYLARVLSPEGFGMINFAFAAMTYFLMLATLGLPFIGPREVVRNRDNFKMPTVNLIVLRLVMTAISFVLLLGFAWFLPKPVEIKWLIILYGLMLWPSAILLDWVFQGLEKMEYTGLARILPAALYLLMIIILVRQADEILRIPVLQVLTLMLTAGLLWWLFWRHYGSIRFRPDWSYIRRIFGASLTIGITNLLNLFIFNAPLLLLGFMRGNAEVGFYSAGLKLVMVLIFGAAAYFDAIYPLGAQYYQTSHQQLLRLQTYSVKLVLALAIPMMVGGIMLAEPIIRLIYGTQYEPAVIGYQGLVIFAALNMLNMVFGRALWFTDRQNVLMRIMLFLAVLNLSLNGALINTWGLRGAVLATILTEVTAFIVQYRAFRRVVVVPVLPYLWKPLLAGGVMFLILWLAMMWCANLFALVIAGGLFYSMTFFAFGGVTMEEIRYLQKLLSSKQ
jgi:O-antigen/teichoic acid export membrane protein